MNRFPYLLLLLLLLAACQPQGADSTGTPLPPPPSTTAGPEATAAPEATATGEAATPTDDAPPPTTPPTVETLLCPEIARPAVGLAVPGSGHLIVDPASGESCAPAIPADAGRYQATDSAVYYVVRADGELVIERLADDGTQPLSFTAVPESEAAAFHTFIVSPDGTTLAWAAGVEGEAGIESELWVGETSTGDAWTPLPPYSTEGAVSLRRVLTPIRFSDDNSTLFYTLMPYGVGGAWNIFTGRYDNLYALRLGSEAPPELLFDCAPLELTLCLGDFSLAGSELAALAFVDAKNNVLVENGAGETVNTIGAPAGYVAAPTWGPSGDLVFYAADIDDTAAPPQPTTAALYYMASATAGAESMASDPGLLPPQAWLDREHIVTGYSSDGTWGTAVVNLDGAVQPITSAPAGTFVAILPGDDLPTGSNDDPAAEPPDAAARYADKTAGVAIYYPAGWTVLDVDPEIKEAGGIYAVTFQSWTPPAGGSNGVPAGETKLDLVVIADTSATSLDEAIATRQAEMAEMNPTETIVAEERLQLDSGIEAVRWLIEAGADEAITYLTFLDGRVIMISGLGEVGLIDAIARTLEPLAP